MDAMSTTNGETEDDRAQLINEPPSPARKNPVGDTVSGEVSFMDDKESSIDEDMFVRED